MWHRYAALPTRNFVPTMQFELCNLPPAGYQKARPNYTQGCEAQTCPICLSLAMWVTRTLRSGQPFHGGCSLVTLISILPSTFLNAPRG